jgi:predicted nucleotide-binding protein
MVNFDKEQWFVAVALEMSICLAGRHHGLTLDELRVVGRPLYVWRAGIESAIDRYSELIQRDAAGRYRLARPGPWDFADFSLGFFQPAEHRPVSDFDIPVLYLRSLEEDRGVGARASRDEIIRQTKRTDTVNIDAAIEILLYAGRLDEDDDGVFLTDAGRTLPPPRAAFAGQAVDRSQATEVIFAGVKEQLAMRKEREASAPSTGRSEAEESALRIRVLTDYRAKVVEWWTRKKREEHDRIALGAAGRRPPDPRTPVIRQEINKQLDQIRDYLTDAGISGDFAPLHFGDKAIDMIDRATGQYDSAAKTPPNEARSPTPSKPRPPRAKRSSSRTVFIVHGHDTGARNAVEAFVRRVGLTPIILQERASRGKTLIEKFEAHARRSGFAIVLLTPDDVGASAADYKKRKEKALRPRARQNAIAELFYFIGALGRKNVCALVKGEIEEPSDYKGVVYISLDANDWERRLAKELDAAKIKFSHSKLLRE